MRGIRRIRHPCDCRDNDGGRLQPLGRHHSCPGPVRAGFVVTAVSALVSGFAVTTASVAASAAAFAVVSAFTSNSHPQSYPRRAQTSPV
ncbi:hypothetical protein D805_0216 [Bifidobacterium thermophilum RBL67]|uniref:Uncharacterized protein n=1 Tax=Bifidobacterium thermophilum RBL67 TaxID=1254439 RepID=M4RD84_9BIFI|nr:hypothetical protein D805_0216 [Bifidobacterium thermophilum RBL67]